MSDAVKVVQLKTDAMAHLVIRNGAGRKLFDMDVPGVTVTITAPLSARILVEPAQNGVADEKSLNL